MAEDPKRSAEIRRMACHKVAVEIVGPAAAGKPLSDGYKNRFIEVVDFLDLDVQNAAPVVNASGVADPVGSGKMLEPTNGGALTLDQAIELTDWLRDQAELHPELKQVTKLTLISLGIRNPKSLDDAVANLTVAQAEKLRETIEERIS